MVELYKPESRVNVGVSSLPGYIMGLSYTKAVSCNNEDRIDEWLENLPSERASKEQYTKKTLKIPGKKGNYSWAGTLRKIEKLARGRKINLANGIYPLSLFEEVLSINNEAFITLLEDLALRLGSGQASQ